MSDDAVAIPVQEYDVLVVGGGPAGLSAALALSRARRSVLVVDAGEPRNRPAGHVHNYLGREGTPPAELLAIGRDEVASYGGQVTSGLAGGRPARARPRAPPASRPRAAPGPRSPGSPACSSRRVRWSPGRRWSSRHG